MVVYATLLLCAIGAGLLIYRYDVYEREPLPVLALTAGLGCIAMWLVGQIELVSFDALGARSDRAISAVAAVEEESLKLLCVVAVRVLARRKFKDPMDGILYGSMAGIGMAVEESIHYLRELPPGALLLPPAEIVRLAGHLVMGGISGFAVVPAVLRRKHWQWILATCLSAAITLHLGWNWIALASGGAPRDAVEAASGAVLALAGFLFYGALIANASEQSRTIFAPASPRRLWGWPFNRLVR
jgi:RsiW-degrading membrane proteinase PrsW (M82 family)